MSKLTHIAAMLAGLLMGAGLVWVLPSKEAVKASQTAEEVKKTEKSTIITRKTDTRQPDGNRVVVTETVRNVNKNEQNERKTAVPVNNMSAKRFSIGISFSPAALDDMLQNTLRESLRVQNVTLGRRIGDSRLWGEVGYSPATHQFTLGVRAEF